MGGFVMAITGILEQKPYVPGTEIGDAGFHPWVGTSLSPPGMVFIKVDANTQHLPMVSFTKYNYEGNPGEEDWVEINTYTAGQSEASQRQAIFFDIDNTLLGNWYAREDPQDQGHEGPFVGPLSYQLWGLYAGKGIGRTPARQVTISGVVYPNGFLLILDFQLGNDPIVPAFSVEFFLRGLVWRNQDYQQVTVGEDNLDVLSTTARAPIFRSRRAGERNLRPMDGSGGVAEPARINLVRLIKK